uniref:Transforming growth factor beta superfamily signaling ligand n=1 Tax=Ciona intestinalis TaxID=7719 RepID=Q4H3X4_CIOIN|nr:transforming growth factor beta superfamily signaling ligand [Ciona intestinalis]BAE06303.1 transforming growth factor beta superfamily signaling ligand [Ciona intestinalis]|eukprot:NP_001071985.1 transforming growth factor beta superfamily signaling ligand [Ciona intestinalis]
MYLRQITYTLMMVVCMIAAKPRYRKQKRTTEVVSRRFSNPFFHQSSDIKSADGSMATKLKNAMKNLPENVKDDAIHEFLNMFGLQAPDNANSIQQIKKPPKYMVDLYNAIADQDGVTRAPDLLDADTVRSIPNIDSRCPGRCRFDLQAVGEHEVVLDAELHLYFEKPPTRSVSSSRTSNYMIKIYQILSDGDGEIQKTLVAGRRLPARLLGWQIFPLLTSVETWNSRKDDNLGILVECTTDNGEVVVQRRGLKGKSPILILFTNDSRNNIHKAKKAKAMQVLHNAKMATISNQKHHMSATIADIQTSRPRRSLRNENRRQKKNSRKSKNRQNSKHKHQEETNVKSTEDSSFVEYVPHQTKNATTFSKKNNGNHDTETIYTDDQFQGQEYDSNIWETYDLDYASDGSTKPAAETSHSRHPVSTSSAHFPSFSTLSTEASASRHCRRYPLYVDFEEMGWSGWIIHPQGYNAYHCRGKCSFPISQNLKPSNHATVQSIMHTLGLGGQPVDMPCCTPDKLYDINLLYFDHNDYVVLRRYKDMVAASCACR